MLANSVPLHTQHRVLGQCHLCGSTASHAARRLQQNKQPLPVHDNLRAQRSDGALESLPLSPLVPHLLTVEDGPLAANAHDLRQQLTLRVHSHISAHEALVSPGFCGTLGSDNAGASRAPPHSEARARSRGTK
mmetsp:Transcript_22819/g.58046  ORF Transcript_22819/g.58046 Transcript_22819/m.58046 type:complete len:133 (+) Transcript_22819:660-1058(+)